jgi:hypothetical protein
VTIHAPGRVRPPVSMASQLHFGLSESGHRRRRPPSRVYPAGRWLHPSAQHQDDEHDDDDDDYRPNADVHKWLLVLALFKVPTQAKKHLWFAVSCW